MKKILLILFLFLMSFILISAESIPDCKTWEIQITDDNDNPLPGAYELNITLDDDNGCTSAFYSNKTNITTTNNGWANLTFCGINQPNNKKIYTCLYRDNVLKYKEPVSTVSYADNVKYVDNTSLNSDDNYSMYSLTLIERLNSAFIDEIDPQLQKNITNGFDSLIRFKKGINITDSGNIFLNDYTSIIFGNGSNASIQWDDSLQKLLFYGGDIRIKGGGVGLGLGDGENVEIEGGDASNGIAGNITIIGGGSVTAFRGGSVILKGGTSAGNIGRVMVGASCNENSLDSINDLCIQGKIRVNSDAYMRSLNLTHNFNSANATIDNNLTVLGEIFINKNLTLATNRILLDIIKDIEIVFSTGASSNTITFPNLGSTSVMYIDAVQTITKSQTFAHNIIPQQNITSTGAVNSFSGETTLSNTNNYIGSNLCRNGDGNTCLQLGSNDHGDLNIGGEEAWWFDEAATDKARIFAGTWSNVQIGPTAKTGFGNFTWSSIRMESIPSLPSASDSYYLCTYANGTLFRNETGCRA